MSNISYYKLLGWILIMSNSTLRLSYPSCYHPAAQVKEGFLYSPVCARLIATATEYIFYYGLSQFYQLPFYYSTPLYLTIIGEGLSWGYLLYQSHLLGFLEDSTWTILQMYFFIFSKNQDKYLLSLPYLIYMLFFYLPKAYMIIDRSNLGSFYKKSLIQQPDSQTLLWLVPSLCCKPIIWYLIN